MIQMPPTTLEMDLDILEHDSGRTITWYLQGEITPVNSDARMHWGYIHRVAAARVLGLEYIEVRFDGS